MADDILDETKSQGCNEINSGNTCDPGHTNSTLQSYPAGSPKNQRLIAPTPASLAPSQFDRTKVDKLRQVLDVDQLLQGTGEELTDSSIVTEESTVSENLSTMVNRVKVRGLWLAKKIYKHLHIEQGQYEMYLQEVKILKLLTRKPHWHVILLLRHYTDLENRNCLLLSPLAQMTLESFLSQPPSQESKMLIGPWIGCLASGLAHIHAQKVKHKDIKPSNILIHGTNPVIADMGISHRFDNDSKTSGPSAGSLMYEAPEVMDEQPRGRRQDVWSMLCCYMEILAFLKGMKRIVDWLDSLKSAAADQDELAFIQLLLDSFKTDPVERPYARGLAEQIQAICEQRPYKYIGECCVLNNTVNGSSILNYAVNVTQSTLPNPEDLEKGSLLHFVANTALSLEENAFPGAFPSLDSLYRQVSNRTICSIRSAEREFLLSIVPKHTKDGKAYLSLCNRFVESLAGAIESGTYVACLYDAPLGEHNPRYTTEYFEILVGEISNRYLTYQWE